MGVFHEYEVLLKFDLWILMTVSCAISCYIVPRNIESLWYLLENASVQLFKLLTHSSLPWLMTIEAWRRLCPRSTSLVIIVMGLVSYVSAPWTKTVMTLRIMIQINMSTSWQKGVRFTSHRWMFIPKGQECGALVFTLLLTLTSCWTHFLPVVWYAITGMRCYCHDNLECIWIRQISKESHFLGNSW